MYTIYRLRYFFLFLNLALVLIYKYTERRRFYEDDFELFLMYAGFIPYFFAILFAIRWVYRRFFKKNR